SDGSLDAGAVCRLGARAVVVPPDDCGLEVSEPDVPAAHAAARLDVCGLIWPDRPEVAALGEVLTEINTVPRVVAMWGPEGSGVGRAIGDLARIARAAGFIPVRASLIETELMRLVDGRSLFLISREPAESRTRELIEWTLRNPRGHVLLCAGR